MGAIVTTTLPGADRGAPLAPTTVPPSPFRGEGASWDSPLGRTGCSGFTLLEVLVSVVILGTAMVAVLKLHASTVTLAAKAEAMATAARLAKNRMVDLTKTGVPAEGVNEGGYEEPDLSRFAWVERIEESQYSTQRVKVYEVSVEVAWGPNPDQMVRVRTFRLQ